MVSYATGCVSFIGFFMIIYIIYMEKIVEVVSAENDILS